MAQMIPRVSVVLEGFTVRELKVIARAIREVEGHDPDKVALILIDDPALSKEEATSLIRAIWPT